jgi:large subunit ribosomal protein L13
LKEVSAGHLLERAPERLITLAVKGMLPHTALGKKVLKKLKVYAGGTHPHVAQQPQTVELKG